MSLAMSQKPVESGLIGNHRAAAFLDRTLARGTVSHGTLLLGPAGVGKRTALGLFLAALLGRTWTPADGLAAFLSYPDFSLVARERDEKTDKPRKNISVEQIRRLRERLQMGSFLSSWKVAVVDGAEHLSEEAANALLKTLEEPTPNTVIALVADARAGMPETILSRVQILRFGLAAREDIRAALVARGTDRHDADALAGRADGRPGVALTLAADPEAREADEAAVVRAVSVLDAPLHERFRTFAAALPERAGLVEQAEAARGVLAALRTTLADALSLAAGEPGRLRLPDHAAAIGRYAAERSPGDIAARLVQAEAAFADLDANVNPKLVLEHFAYAV